MNIIDMFTSNTPTNAVAKKIAIKNAERRIQAEIEECSQRVLEMYSSKIDWINNDLSWGCNKKFTLTAEEKKALMDKTTEAIKRIPDEIKKAVDEIVNTAETAATAEPEKKVEVSTTTVGLAAAPETAKEVAPSPIFGY